VSGYVRYRTEVLCMVAHYGSMDDFVKHFVRVAPGTWTSLCDGEFTGPNGRIQVTGGSTFRRGTTFMGVDLAAVLEAASDRKASPWVQLGSALELAEGIGDAAYEYD
jgi:hypothetical protein